MIYNYNEKENYFIIHYGDDIKIIVDSNQLPTLLNFNKKLLIDSSETYPYYNANYKKFNIIKILYNYLPYNIIISFKNNNKYDLRKINVSFIHAYNDTIKDLFKIIDYIPGHTNTFGKDANIMKNPIWISENGDYIMYCEPETLCILCDKSFKIIKDFEKNQMSGINITFWKGENGYIVSSHNNLYIHQIIINCSKNGKGTKEISIDHIDQNPLNNKYDNLRIATREMQEKNSKGIKEGTKRERSKNACNLPDEITQDMIPKFVYYVKARDNHGEHFVIDKKHPLTDKDIKGTKSNKKTIIEKLEEIKEKLYNLENGIKTEASFILPQYYRLGKNRGDPTLFYEKRTNEKRYGYLMKLKEDKVDEEILKNFNKKLFIKYPELDT